MDTGQYLITARVAPENDIRVLDIFVGNLVVSLGLDFASKLAPSSWDTMVRGKSLIISIYITNTINSPIHSFSGPCKIEGKNRVLEAHPSTTMDLESFHWGEPIFE